MENGLVGKWFLTTKYSDILDQHVPMRGKFVEDLGFGSYRIEILDLVIGELESCVIVNVAYLAGWRLFSSEDEWKRISERAISFWQKKYVAESVLG
jgi:hypothetical protein